MTTPEAISLAHELVPMWDKGSLEREDLVEAATELYRLHEQNQKLLGALKYHQEQTRPIQRTIDAIAAAGDTQQAITDPAEIRRVFKIDEADYPPPDSGFAKL